MLAFEKMTSKPPEELLGRVANLKKRLVSKYGSALLSVQSTESVKNIFTADSEASVSEKSAENRRVVSDRAREWTSHEPDMVAELELLMDRIKTARSGSSGYNVESAVPAHPSPQFVCVECGNKDSNNTRFEHERGDIVCIGVDNRGCGRVLTDHLIHAGSEKRNFEGQLDRNHHGAAFNRLMPDAVNLQTSLDTYVRGKPSAAAKRLERAGHEAELNLSTVDTKTADQRTREGYKTLQKRQAFAKMNEIADNVCLSRAVVTRAQEEFCRYRHAREAVQQYEGVVLACLVLAYEELLAEETVPGVIATRDPGAPDDDPIMGAVRPRCEVVGDAAVSTVPECELAKFDWDQVRTWLEAVRRMEPPGDVYCAAHVLNNREFGKVLIDWTHRQAEEARPDGKSPNKRARRGESVLGSRANFLGTTTIADRLHRYGEAHMSAPAPSQVATGGQMLLRCRLSPLFVQHNSSRQGVSRTSGLSPPALAGVVDHFQAALDRRSEYDERLREAERVHQLQRKRLRIEEAPRLISKQVQQRVPGEPDQTWEETSPGPTQAATSPQDFDLEDLVGGPVLSPSLLSPPRGPPTTVADLARPPKVHRKPPRAPPSASAPALPAVPAPPMNPCPRCLLTARDWA